MGAPLLGKCVQRHRRRWRWRRGHRRSRWGRRQAAPACRGGKEGQRRGGSCGKGGGGRWGKGGGRRVEVGGRRWEGGGGSAPQRVGGQGDVGRGVPLENGARSAPSRRRGGHQPRGLKVLGPEGAEAGVRRREREGADEKEREARPQARSHKAPSGPGTLNPRLGSDRARALSRQILLLILLIIIIIN